MQARRRIVVVHNAAKRSDALDTLAAAAQNAGIDIKTVRTSCFSEGRVAANRAVQEGCDMVVAAGGDGTLLSVLEPVLAADRPVGVLPLGTANDFAREMGIRSTEDAIASIVEGAERSVDVVWCEYITADGESSRAPMCAVGGVGVIAEAIRLGTTPRGRRLISWLGETGWAALAIYAAGRGRPHRARLRIDGRPFEHGVQSVDVLNVGGMGGWPVIHGSAADTGSLHAMVTGRSGVLGVARLLWTVSWGRRASSLPYVDVLNGHASENRWGLHSVRRLEVDADEPLPVHVMGEAVGFTPASYEVDPGRLRVCVPASVAVSFSTRAAGSSERAAAAG